MWCSAFRQSALPTNPSQRLWTRCTCACDAVQTRNQRYRYMLDGSEQQRTQRMRVNVRARSYAEHSPHVFGSDRASIVLNVRVLAAIALAPASTLKQFGMLDG